MLNKIKQTALFLEKKGVIKPQIGIVLGTGLGKLIEKIEINLCVDYKDIPNFPLSTVESHSGKLIYGKLKGKTVLAMQGRFHYYEGYNLQEITLPIRVMKQLGIEYLLLSNAAGALNLKIRKGELMLLNDHINFIPDSPLRGKHFDEFGPRFTDMSQPYSEKLNSMLMDIAKNENVALHKGVYVAVIGPNLETKAEYRMFNKFADAIGMSTVPEVIVANQMGLHCAAISVITDECDPDNLKPTNIKDIIEAAGKAENKLITLYCKLIEKM